MDGTSLHGDLGECPSVKRSRKRSIACLGNESLDIGLAHQLFIDSMTASAK